MQLGASGWLDRYVIACKDTRDYDIAQVKLSYQEGHYLRLVGYCLLVVLDVIPLIAKLVEAIRLYACGFLPLGTESADQAQIRSMGMLAVTQLANREAHLFNFLHNFSLPILKPETPLTPALAESGRALLSIWQRHNQTIVSSAKMDRSDTPKSTISVKDLIYIPSLYHSPPQEQKQPRTIRLIDVRNRDEELENMTALLKEHHLTLADKDQTSAKQPIPLGCVYVPFLGDTEASIPLLYLYMPTVLAIATDCARKRIPLTLDGNNSSVIKYLYAPILSYLSFIGIGHQNVPTSYATTLQEATPLSH